MILQKEFEAYGYQNLLQENVAAECGIDLEDLFDLDDIPEELLGIYISDLKDELFFLLDGESMSVDKLTNQWDDRIRLFTIINGKKDSIRRLKYNIIQLINCSGEVPDKSREADLYITRKIIIKGDLTDKTQIIIDDAEAIELPFHMIPADVFAPDGQMCSQLSQLMPADSALFDLMKTGRTKVKRREGLRIQNKNFEEPDYEKIKEWLER